MNRYINNFYVAYQEEVENVNLLPFCYEWEDDEIERVRIAKIVPVTKRLYDYVENTVRQLPESIQVTCNYSDHHNFIICDGRRSLAVDTLGTMFPLMKSRLTFKDEEFVIANYKKRIMKYADFGDDLLDLDEDDIVDYDEFANKHNMYVGYTRKQREDKMKLIELIEDSIDKELNEVAYIHTVIMKENLYKESLKKNKNELISEMIDKVNNYYNNNEFSIYEELVGLFVNEY